LGGLNILGGNGAAILLIALGIYILVRGFMRNSNRGSDAAQ
jgi:hypothetical protein